VFRQGLDRLTLCSALDQFNSDLVFREGKERVPERPPSVSEFELGMGNSAQPRINSSSQLQSRVRVSLVALGRGGGDEARKTSLPPISRLVLAHPFAEKREGWPTRRWPNTLLDSPIPSLISGSDRIVGKHSMLPFCWNITFMLHDVLRCRLSCGIRS
jgi:hypothetical protein